MKELQSIGLDLSILDKDNNEIDIKRNFDHENESLLSELTTVSDSGSVEQKDLKGFEYSKEENDSDEFDESDDDFSDELDEE